MPNFSPYNLILVRYPFSDLSASKVRPAVIVSSPHVSHDLFIVPLTSRLAGLLPGEFVLQDWQSAGLHVPSAIKRGIYTIATSIVLQDLGILTPEDQKTLDTSLTMWLVHV